MLSLQTRQCDVVVLVADKHECVPEFGLRLVIVTGHEVEG